MVRGARARIKRGETVLGEGMISSLKRFKDDVREVLQGLECGIGIEGDQGRAAERRHRGLHAPRRSRARCSVEAAVRTSVGSAGGGGHGRAAPAGRRIAQGQAPRPEGSEGHAAPPLRDLGRRGGSPRRVAARDPGAGLRVGRLPPRQRSDLQGHGLHRGPRGRLGAPTSRCEILVTCKASGSNASTSSSRKRSPCSSSGAQGPAARVRDRDRGGHDAGSQARQGLRLGAGRRSASGPPRSSALESARGFVWSWLRRHLDLRVTPEIDVPARPVHGARRAHPGAPRRAQASRRRRRRRDGRSRASRRSRRPSSSICSRGPAAPP